ncbi:MAG: hypothetical protein D6769_01350 [Methanobacteriota archaeon]|nr:MAG: hypothetical protein D6769_01350 [Euryarchaeota archaeon]
MNAIMKGMLIFTLAVFILLYLFPDVSGLTMLFTIFIFGAFSHYAKTRQEKLLTLAMLVLLSIFILLVSGLRLGIDFKGGTRIPVTLSSQADPQIMQEIVSKIKSRVSSLGLEQVVVKAVGNDRIFIEVPAGDEELVGKVEDVVTTQGIFKAVVDGVVVLEGKDIIPGTVAPIPASQMRGADWGISFSITKEAAQNFALKVKGKANMPLYLYLDKPYGSVVILPSSWLVSEAGNLSASGLDISPVSLFTKLKQALEDETGSVTLLLDTADVDSLPSNSTIITSKEIAESLSLDNATIVSESDLVPQVSIDANGEPYPTSWKALGLMSAPNLAPGVTDGSISTIYQISGPAPNGLTSQEKYNYVKKTERLTASVLKGGAFPVKLYIGSKETIPAPLGKKFLEYSFQGLLVAIAAVSLFIALRYRSIKLIGPIIGITLAELLILVATVGSFTIDLSAMAGLIAAVGVSIDAQIIITDELLKHTKHEEALRKAFEVINNNVLLAILVFVPLFITGIVEVIGFAVTSILSYVLGALVSRPAYAALVEHMFEEKG